MLDYRSLMYQLIGARVRHLRETAGIRPDGIQVENSMLSKIENGHAGKRNPNLMNPNHIRTLCKTFHTTPEGLVWGGREEKSACIKMILLGILVNGEGNVFARDTVKDWEKVGSYDLGETFEKVYRFFTDPDSYNRYGLLAPGYDKAYEKLSNLVLKMLLLDYGFSKAFLSNIIGADGEPLSSGLPRTKIQKFITGRGSYADLILSREGTQYLRFMEAFQKFWDRAEEDYLQFFEKEIFLKNEELKRYGLKNLQNSYIHGKLISPKFIRLNESLLISAEYADREAVVSSLNMRLCLAGVLLKEQMAGQGSNDAFEKWYADLRSCFEDSVSRLLQNHTASNDYISI